MASAARPSVCRGRASKSSSSPQCHSLPLEPARGPTRRVTSCQRGGQGGRPHLVPDCGGHVRAGAGGHGPLAAPGALTRAVLPGAVYVCTEDAFPSQRLQQLIAQQQRLRTDVPREVVRRIKFSNQIFIEHAADVVSVLPRQTPVPICPPFRCGRAT